MSALKNRIKDLEKAQELLDIYIKIGLDSSEISKTIKAIKSGSVKYSRSGLSDIKRLRNLKLLSEVPGFGPQKILEIYKTNRLGTLTKYQKIGYKYYKDIVRKIPLFIGINIFKTISKQLLPGIVTLAGSLRREKRYAGDLDLLYSGDLSDFKTKVAQFVVSLADGDKRVTFLGRFDNKYIPEDKEEYIYYTKEELLSAYLVQIDVRKVDSDSFPTMLLYFTGSKEFNIMCRAKAQELGMTLNEYGLFKSGTKINKSETEIEILQILGLEEYTNPRSRSI
jgi:DNA polymerase/3'-5' exonuclease PolX